MKKKLSMILASLCIVAAAARAQETPTLAQFDEEVAVSRRVMRDYCAIVQAMMKEKELDNAKQDQGLALLDDSIAKWNVVQNKYAANPPAEYAGDAAFKARLQDITNAAEDMRTALAAGHARRSMLACGFACGLFVTMHEENGLDYALDKLFHLRKTGKTATALFKAKGLDAIRPLLPKMLQQRDEVLLAPLPWPEGDAQNAEYLVAVRVLSESLDQLALASTRGDAAQVGEILNQFLSLVNKPYGICL